MERSTHSVDRRDPAELALHLLHMDRAALGVLNKRMADA